ncbi:MAG: hypothetical protein ACTSR8_21490 [Promethearchaeota archaeon]
MTEEFKLKERFGALGLYLVEKAQDEINELHRQVLFQKSNIRKTYTDKLLESSKKMRNELIESYKTYLNRNITSTLMSSKEKLLKLKNRLIKELKEYIISDVNERINKNYASYIKYILEFIKLHKELIDRPLEAALIFNSRDYNYFKAHPNKINEIFKNPITIQESTADYIGGFYVYFSKTNISYDYSFNTITNKNYSLIEKEFSKQVDDSKFSKLEIDFEKVINTKKTDIQKFLQEYDQIE